MNVFSCRAVTAAVLLAAMAVSSAAQAADAITVWIHGSRGDTEPREIQRQIETWNKRNPDHPAELVILDKDYADKLIQSKALAADWPDILDFDGPNYANAAWAGLLAPLDELLPASTLDGLLPSIKAQGTFAPDGRLYAVGQFDSGLGLWGSKSTLRQAGVRIPSGIEDAWTGEEFEAVLAALKSVGFETPLDAKLSYGVGEWFTYGLLPIVQSYGGDVIDRERWRAEGTLNGPATVRAITHLKSWADKGYLVPASAGDDAFYGADRKAALALVGHWMWPAHSAALGDDLVLLPMPKFGDRHVTGMGSWNWGIWSGSPRKEMAGKLLDHFLSRENVAAMSAVAGAVPALTAVAEQTPAYAPGGPMAIYTEQLVGIAAPRPSHPGYPVISAAFAEAIAGVLAGGDPKSLLDVAVAKVDQDIDQTAGYVPFGN